jgi:hypothetical protein
MNVFKRAMDDRTDMLLRAIRLERRRGIADRALAAAQWLAIGALIGSAIALFAAPSSGEELRSQVGSRFQGARDRLQGARDKAREAAAKMRKRTNARENARARA